MSVRKEVLVAARDIIERQDHVPTGIYRDPNDDCLCATGALGVAAGVPRNELCSYEIVEAAFDEIVLLGEIAGAVPNDDAYDAISRVAVHNDQHGRESVLNLFDSAIAAA